MADKRIKDLTILTTAENNDELVIDDISVADSEKTKKITKANFLKEIVANFANYYSKTESDNRYLQSFTEEDPIFSAWLLDTPPLYSFTETDPVFTSHPAFGLTTQDMTDIGNLSGTNTGDQNLSGLVPYTGATTDVDLGANDLSVNKLTVITTANTGADIQGGIDFDTVVEPIAPTLALDTGGALDVGKHYYFITYTTALGESAIGASANIDTDAVNNAVNVTLPVSTDPRVTGRKIYRSKVGTSSDTARYLATISNNTTTLYKDIIADASLPANVYDYYRPDTTNRMLSVDGTSIMKIGTTATYFGILAGGNYQSAFNTGFGSNALRYSQGQSNSGFGYGSGDSITSGQDNSLFGYRSGTGIVTGSYNSVLGSYAFDDATGSSNSAMGYAALGNSTTGSQNSGFGMYAGRKITTGTYNSFLGYGVGDQAGQLVDATYSTAIGASAYTDASYQMDLGGTSVTEILAGRSDNVNLTFGAGKDASIYYDGTNLVVNPQEVGTGSLKVNIGTGNLEVVGSGDFILTSSTGRSGALGFAGGSDNILQFGPTTTNVLRAVFGMGAISTGNGGAVNTLPTGDIEMLDINGDIRTTFKTGGNVGIGTITPETKMDVAGSIRATAWNTPTSGKSLVFGINADVPTIIGYDYTGGAYLPFDMRSSNFLFKIGVNLALSIDASKNVKLPNDNAKLYFGTGDDEYIEYDASLDGLQTAGKFKASEVRAIHKAVDGTAPVANGTYVMGIGAVTNGTITIKDGVITAIQEASD